MKYLFKSDKFSFIHPYLNPRKIHEYTTIERKEANENTNKIKINRPLFNMARQNSNDAIPYDRYGSILVFPSEVKFIKNDTTKSKYLDCIDYEDDNLKDRNRMKKFIKKMFNETESQLSSEYSNKEDPTCYFDISDDGSVFSANFENSNKITNEEFNNKSISIYVAGCNDMTAEYLFEELLDRCYIESEKHDKRIIKKGKPNSSKIGFDRFRTFLVYDLNNHQFHQIGVKENELYYKPKPHKRASVGFNNMEYEMCYSGNVDTNINEE